MITGSQISYFMHCKRQLWLFSKHIKMEDNSENVLIGRHISDNTFTRQKHEVEIEGIKIDFFDSAKKEIHEIKKSDRMDELHVIQLKYYLYILQKKGVESIKGIIDYPLLKKKKEINLTMKDIDEMEKLLTDINSILQMTVPPPVIELPLCKSCSYFDLCYV